MNDLVKIQIPQWLKPGDLLRVIFPSGTLREFEGLFQGIEIWKERGYRVELSSDFDRNWGYLAGTDGDRCQQLADALTDPNCRGLLCGRGGYGSARLLEDWSWRPTLKSPSPIPNPKWLIGFSDITALLWSQYKVGIAGVHAPVLTTLAAEPDWSRQRLFDCVEGRSLAPLSGCGWGGGEATGILLPANLTVATHLLGTPAQPNFEGAILALEDVSEMPYRIDRYLTQWRMSGAIGGIRGIALGRFSQCQAPIGVPSFTVEQVLRDRLGTLNIPIVSDLPFGHNGANAALLVGVPVRLDADNGILEF